MIPGWGTSLVSHPLVLFEAQTAGDPFIAPISNAPNLIGLPFSVQVLSYANDGVTETFGLTNALDTAIGGWQPTTVSTLP